MRVYCGQTHYRVEITHGQLRTREVFCTYAKSPQDAEKQVLSLAESLKLVRPAVLADAAPSDDCVRR